MGLGGCLEQRKSEILDYYSVKRDFEQWLKRRVSKTHAEKLLYYLDKYLVEPIKSPKDMEQLISKVKGGRRHFCMGVRNLLKFYEEHELMDVEIIEKYRKIVKIPQTGVDTYVPSDEEIINAYKKAKDERYKLLFKLLAVSGLRLCEGVWLLSNFDKRRLMVNRKIAKYPLNLDRRTKRAHFAYMPLSVAEELKKIRLSFANAQSYLAKKMGLPAKYIRKWHYNFLILNGVPESVADFIQGRSPISVGSMHYLAKVKQSDEWYAKVADKLVELFH